MKKNLLFTFLLIIAVLALRAQTGINTQTPSNATVLDIQSTDKGILLPRIQLQSATQYQPLAAMPPDGTLVFNLATVGTGSNKLFQGYYQWQTNKWIRPLEAGFKPIIQFTQNSTSTINFNASTAGIDLDIFGAEKFSYDGASAAYTKNSNTALKINETGLYQVTLNLALKETPPKAYNVTEFYVAPKVDGVEEERVLSRVPQWRTSAADINGQFEMSFTFYLNVNAGQILTFRSTRFNTNSDGATVINFDTSTYSSLTILRLK